MDAVPAVAEVEDRAVIATQEPAAKMAKATAAKGAKN